MNAPVQLPRLMSLRQVAAALGVSEPMVRKLAKLGRLPTITVGSRRLVDEADLAAFIEAHRQRSNVVDLHATGR